MEHFCQGDIILDQNQLWNDTTPIFNRCFQHTIPVWLPAIFLWLFGPWQMFSILKSGHIKVENTIPLNLYNLSRLTAVAAIIAVNIIQGCYDLWYFWNPNFEHFASYADLTSSVLNVFTFILFGFLIYLHRLYGIHTSGIAWLFTFLSLILALPTVYMYVFFYGNDEVLSDGLHVGVRTWDPVEMGLFAGHFALLLVIFLLTCFADHKPCKVPKETFGKNNSEAQNGLYDLKAPLHRKLSSEDEPTEECPELKASFLSRIIYWWFNTLALTGFKKALTLNDLWRLNREYLTSTIATRFDRAWLSQIKYSREEVVRYAKTATSNGAGGDQTLDSQLMTSFVDPASRNKPTTFSALLRTFGWYFLSGAIFKLIHDLLMFVNPQLLKLFIGFISQPNEPIWHGLVIASLFFITAMVQTILINYYFHVMYSIGMRVRTALISAIYRKSLNLSNVARRDITTGEIVNLMSVDAQRFVDLIPYVNLVWSSPMQVCFTMYFLWLELGPSVFAGLVVLIALIPLNAWISKVQRALQIKQMERKDERVKVINEALGGIRVIKLYGWEVPFIGKISSIRAKEIAQLKQISFINAFMSITWTCSPFVVSFVTFAVYVLSSSDNVLDAKKAFVSLSLFELLRFPLTMLPEMITSVVMASVSVKRVDRFLNSEQLEKYVTRDDSPYAVTVDSGTFAWSTAKTEEEANDADKPKVAEKEKLVPNGNNGNASSKITLSAINMKVPKGSLVAIVGTVGSGKSSLLSAILGDMERVDGKVNVAKDETVAYIAQQAWIQNATLRDNILFGLPYNKKLYEAVLDMCALAPDIAILPGGDQTEIGEKGINLSGGQKQRVAIARACYSSASLVLLDDPLSAVDSHVAKHIFARVIHNSTGYLRHRTRVLVTNNISVLPDVDQIIVLHNGSISETGTYSELIAKSGDFAEFIREHANEKDDSNSEEEADEGGNELATISGTGSVVRHRTRTTSSSSDKTASFQRQTLTKQENIEDEKLIEAERAETGNVKWSVYMQYFRSLTCFWITFMLIGYIGMQVASMGANVWLAMWSNDSNQAVQGERNLTDNSTTTPFDDEQRNYRLAVFGALGIAQGLFFFLGAFSLVKGTVKSSITLHSSLLYRIMRSPIAFFDTTPLGRIVNRFSKDIDTVDSTIPMTIDGFLICFLQTLFTLIIISIQVPIFLAVVVPILLLYVFIQKFYVATSRQLKRLESVTRSPIYSHFGETLHGVSTIRAFDATKRFIAESNRRVDTNQRCYFPSFIANRWLSVRLEFCGNLIVLFAAIFSALSKDSFVSQPGFIGLIMTYSLSVTDVLNWCVRMTSEMETNVVSVERIGEYCENETEADWTREKNDTPTIPNGWPEKGEIEFANYSVRYRAGLDLVLKRINLKVKAGEKVGVVGRTGAGKSSLTLALFRMLEADQGQILLDGIDISKIGLHELRSKLSIIPQDPVLFSGTIRSNLDPFGLYTDGLIWRALEHSHLKQYIFSQDEQLDHPVAENGSNLSVGQRQLVCLGRALLRKTKILVLDEATAAIDLETDSLIQDTIQSEFAHCTVLTIAHRLHTIMDSDRVLVLDQGTVAEFDSPANLLADRRSRFYALAKDARLI